MIKRIQDVVFLIFITFLFCLPFHLAGQSVVGETTSPKQPVKPAERVEGIDELNSMPAVDKQLYAEIESQLKSLVAAQESIKKLSYTSFVPWQKREIAAKAHKEIKKIIESLLLSKTFLVKRAALAKNVQYEKEIVPTQQAQVKLNDAYTQASNMMNMLDAKNPFEKNDVGEWKKLAEDLDGRLRNTAKEIIAANDLLVGANKKGNQAKKSSTTETPPDMPVSEMIAFLTDLEILRLGFINFGMVEMQESINNDFYIAALKAAGNQPSLVKLLIAENKRQLQLSKNLVVLIKQADSAIAICNRIGKVNQGLLYKEFKKEFNHINVLTNKINIEFLVSGDFTRKDANELKAIVDKMHPDMRKAIDIIFGIVQKVPPALH